MDLMTDMRNRNKCIDAAWTAAEKVIDEGNSDYSAVYSAALQAARKAHKANPWPCASYPLKDIAASAAWWNVKWLLAT